VAQGARQQVTDLAGPPYSGICLIQCRYDDLPDIVYGTGVLVGPGTVATAGHVLWNKAGHAARLILPDHVDVFLGDGFYDPNDHLSWTFNLPTSAVSVHPEFLAGDDTKDVARIILPHQMTGVLPMLDLPGNLQVGDNVTISGFPKDCSPFGEWEASGPLSSLDAPVFQHQVETGEGQSGAPVRLLRDGAWMVIGLHVIGQGGDGEPPIGSATAITPDIRAWLQST
jgi:V8-like Glu-specific endopeptidase